MTHHFAVCSVLNSQPPHLTAIHFSARPKIVVEIAPRIWYPLSTPQFNSADMHSKNCIRSLKTYFYSVNGVTPPSELTLRARLPRLTTKDMHRRD